MTGTVVRRRERGTSLAVAVTALAIFALGCGDGLLAPTESVQAPSALAVGVDPATGAKIETNKDDYPPGDTVRITGSGWAVNEVVVLFVTEDPSMHPDWTFSATADGSGGFVHTGLVMDDLHLGVTFTLTATGQSSGSVAQTTFTDANSAIGTFSITPSPVEPEEDLTWSATATCTGPPTGPQSCGMNGSSVGGNVPAGYTINLLRAVGQCGTAGQSFSQVATATTVGTTGTAGGTVAAPATPGSYAFRTSHPTEGNWAAVGQGTTSCVTVVVEEPEVENQPPVADAGGPYSGNQGTDIALDGTGSDDPDGDIASYEWTIVTNLTGGACGFVEGIDNVAELSVNCADDGTLTVRLTVTDDDGATDSDDATVTVTNTPPIADAGDDSSGDEGSDITLDGRGSSDPDGTIVSYEWEIVSFDNADGGSCAIDDASADSTSVACDDDGTLVVKLTVTDDDGATDEDEATVTVANANPSVAISSPAAYSVWSITGFASVVDLINASFTDAGSNDTHSCLIDWGNSTNVAGVVDQTNDTCKLTPATNPYTSTGAGIYTIRVTVTDDDAGSGYAEVTIVVYDPEAGFVTGGGWINSPAGAYKADPSLTGKAHFGFVSKYLKGATRPSGNTEFQFQAAGLNFHSSNYEWLVVNQAGTSGQFKGIGTINGAGSYGFMLWAIDGASTGSPDAFRIRIWSESGGVETDIYDNGFNQALASGSVVVHTGGKKK